MSQEELSFLPNSAWLLEWLCAEKEVWHQKGAGIPFGALLAFIGRYIFDVKAVRTNIYSC